ncbi:MAG: DUF1566 domain-containing protein [Thermodesulfobacteriota bacterium]
MLKWLPILFLVFLSACADSDDIDRERFQVNNNGTILDKQTNLLWADSDNHQSLNWSAAQSYCDSYTGADYHDWRMPKQTELAALYAAGIREGGPLITIVGQRLWAAETKDTTGAYCDFKEGGCSWAEKVVSLSLHALPVRNVEAGITLPPSAVTHSKPQSVEQRLQVLDRLRKQQLITDEEFNSKKSAILNEL